MNVAIDADDAVSLAAHGENRRLRRIDDCGEAIRPARTEVGETDRCALQLLLPQPAVRCPLDGFAPTSCQLEQAQLLDAMENWNQQTILDGYHQSDMSAVRRHDTGVRGVGVSAERCIQGWERKQCACDTL